MRANQGFGKIEPSLVDELFTALNKDYSVCYETSKPYDKFYSPFVLALIGIFIKTTQNNKYSHLLKGIYNKLAETFNSNGLYNFYGNDTYYFDVDSTSVINTFLFLYDNNLQKYLKVSKLLLRSMDKDAGFLHTWLNKPVNTIDWFVNFNNFVLNELLGNTPKLQNSYLIHNCQKFLSNGSVYYKDLSFPLFLIKFYEHEYAIKIDDKTSYDNSSMVNFLQKIKCEINTNYDTNLKQVDSIVYFNSSNHRFMSKELTFAIYIYFLNRRRNYE